MSHRAVGVYREVEFSPGKVDADAAILDASLAELAREGLAIEALTPTQFLDRHEIQADLVLAMCQSESALRRLAEVERDGAVAINSALAIRNCYRDLLAAGLGRAGVPTPIGALVRTDERLDHRVLGGVDLEQPVFVKRGDLHALGSDDVQRAVGRTQVESILAAFARRGVRRAYIQQEHPGAVVKFYGVSGGSYFTAIAQDGEVPEAAVRELSEAAQRASSALGLEAWGGDAVMSEGRFAIIDFNDWPSFSKVRGQAARAIARRGLSLLARAR
jgi:glutathione synthase/RimK-type ligase-like ATP-grasp enzyme